jgi:hypothetical protein
LPGRRKVHNKAHLALAPGLFSLSLPPLAQHGRLLSMLLSLETGFSLLQAMKMNFSRQVEKVNKPRLREVTSTNSQHHGHSDVETRYTIFYIRDREFLRRSRLVGMQVSSSQINPVETALDSSHIR